MTTLVMTWMNPETRVLGSLSPAGHVAFARSASAGGGLRSGVGRVWNAEASGNGAVGTAVSKSSLPCFWGGFRMSRASLEPHPPQPLLKRRR